MARYMISGQGNGDPCAIAKCDDMDRYSMWCSYNCEWQENDTTAWGAFIGFEDWFRDIGEAEALKIMKSYEQREG